MRIYFMPRSNVIIPSCHYAPEFPRCAKLHLISLFMRARLAHTLTGHKEHPLLPREGGGGTALREAFKIIWRTSLTEFPVDMLPSIWQTNSNSQILPCVLNWRRFRRIRIFRVILFFSFSLFGASSPKSAQKNPQKR